MRNSLILRQKGVTLVELLVVLVVLSFVMGAIYRLFIAQTRAYTVQDQVVEIQQNVRSTMEILLRDLRMTGYDDDTTTAVTVPTPIATPVQDSDIRVSYEYNGQRYTVHYYWTGAPALELRRQLTKDVLADPEEPILTNVDAFTFTYGVDTDEDGDVDNWVNAAGVGTSKVIAVQVSLTARPTTINPDVQARISPRRLTSTVTFRNLIMK